MQDERWEGNVEDIQHYTNAKNTQISLVQSRQSMGPPKVCTTIFLTAGGTTLLKEKKSTMRWRKHFSNFLNRLSTVNTTVLDWKPQKPIVDSLDLHPTLDEVNKPSVRLFLVMPLGWIKFLMKSSSQQDWWNLKHSTVFSLAFGRKKTCPMTSGMPQLSYFQKWGQQSWLWHLLGHLCPVHYWEDFGSCHP